MSDDQLNEIARVAFERHCGRLHPWEEAQSWVIAAMRDASNTVLLAPTHSGMKIDYSGLFNQARRALEQGGKEPALAEMLRQLQGHLTELGQRWYASDTAVVDEILQLYCVEGDARKALKRKEESHDF